MQFGSIKRDPADQWFSRYVRRKAGWKCQRCFRHLGEGGGEASHYWSRRHEATRFDLENVQCLCNACHRKFHEDPGEYADWMRRRLGQGKYSALDIRAHSYCKRDRGAAAMAWKKLYEKEFAS